MTLVNNLSYLYGPTLTCNCNPFQSSLTLSHPYYSYNVWCRIRLELPVAETIFIFYRLFRAVNAKILSNYIIALLLSNHIIALLLSNHIIALLLSNHIIALLLSNHIVALLLSNHIVARLTSQTSFRFRQRSTEVAVEELSPHSYHGDESFDVDKSPSTRSPIHMIADRLAEAAEPRSFSAPVKATRKFRFVYWYLVVLKYECRMTTQGIKGGWRGQIERERGRTGRHERGKYFRISPPPPPVLHWRPICLGFQGWVGTFGSFLKNSLREVIEELSKLAQNYF